MQHQITNSCAQTKANLNHNRDILCLFIADTLLFQTCVLIAILKRNLDAVLLIFFLSFISYTSLEFFFFWSFLIVFDGGISFYIEQGCAHNPLYFNSFIPGCGLMSCWVFGNPVQTVQDGRRCVCFTQFVWYIKQQSVGKQLLNSSCLNDHT